MFLRAPFLTVRCRHIATGFSPILGCLIHCLTPGVSYPPCTVQYIMNHNQNATPMKPKPSHTQLNYGMHFSSINISCHCSLWHLFINCVSPPFILWLLAAQWHALHTYCTVLQAYSTTHGICSIEYIYTILMSHMLYRKTYIHKQALSEGHTIVWRPVEGCIL